MYTTWSFNSSWRTPTSLLASVLRSLQIFGSITRSLPCSLGRGEIVAAGVFFWVTSVPRTKQSRCPEEAKLWLMAMDRSMDSQSLYSSFHVRSLYHFRNNGLPAYHKFLKRVKRWMRSMSWSLLSFMTTSKSRCRSQLRKCPGPLPFSSITSMWDNRLVRISVVRNPVNQKGDCQVKLINFRHSLMNHVVFSVFICENRQPWSAVPCKTLQTKLFARGAYVLKDKSNILFTYLKWSLVQQICRRTHVQWSRCLTKPPTQLQIRPCKSH